MKLDKFQQLSVRVVLLFTVAIFSTFIPDYFHSFFGDELCKGQYFDYASNHSIGCLKGDWGLHDPTWHWGYRHWLYFFMCIILFIINVGSIIDVLQKEKKSI